MATAVDDETADSMATDDKAEDDGTADEEEEANSFKESSISGDGGSGHSAPPGASGVGGSGQSDSGVACCSEMVSFLLTTMFSRDRDRSFDDPTTRSFSLVRANGPDTPSVFLLF